MGGSKPAQCTLALGERNVADPFATSRSVLQELKPERRLAGAGIAFDQEQLISRKSPAQHIVQTGDPAGCPFEHVGDLNSRSARAKGTYDFAPDPIWILRRWGAEPGFFGTTSVSTPSLRSHFTLSRSATSGNANERVNDPYDRSYV